MTGTDLQHREPTIMVPTDIPVLPMKLGVSPLNVRDQMRGDAAVDALAANIAAKGLQFPLFVHAMDASDEFAFGVLAGSRRLRAIQLLVKQGDWAPDRAIPCKLFEGTPAQLKELSLDENLLRQDLTIAETNMAIADLIAEGVTAEGIAARSGQTLRWVRQQARLGQLEPIIFAAYADGKLSLDQTCAYASTEDHQLQRAAFEQLHSRPSYEHSPHHIRAFLKVGDREMARLLRLVGDQAYRSAGGRFELDLFADGPDDRGRVIDEGLLRALADKELDVRREQVRILCQDRGLRFLAEPPKFSGHMDTSLEFFPTRSADGTIRLPKDYQDGDIVATLHLQEDGSVQDRFWWSSRKAKSGAQKVGAAPQDPIQPDQAEAINDGGRIYLPRARAAVKAEHGLTADGLDVARALRRELLRAFLIQDTRSGSPIARDYLIWSQLRSEMKRENETDTGARPIRRDHTLHGEGNPDLARSVLDDAIAHHIWTEACNSIAAEEFMRAEDMAESLTFFFEAPQEVRDLAAGVLAGLALIRSANTPGFRVGAHDRLARHLAASDAKVRVIWEPSASFTGLFPKMKRLELAQPHVDPAAFKSWVKADDRTLTGATAGALAAARGWVHPLLTFETAPAEEAPADDEAREAAE